MVTDFSAAEQNDPYLAQVNQALDLKKTDPVRAFESLQALSQQGSVNAMLQVGYAYLKGIGTAVDLKQAETWYLRAREAGSEQATDSIEWIHLKELQTADPVRALESLQSLSQQGSVNAMLRLGWAHERGIGTAVDLKQAETWYLRAREGGSVSDANDRLGSIYWGRKDYANACTAFAAGAAANNLRCMYWLGRMYRDGLGIDKQPETARTLFEQASLQGNLFARIALARLLMSGRFGVAKIFKGFNLYLVTLKNAMAACSKDEIDDRFLH